MCRPRCFFCTHTRVVHGPRHRVRFVKFVQAAENVRPLTVAPTYLLALPPRRTTLYTSVVLYSGVYLLGGLGLLSRLQYGEFSSSSSSVRTGRRPQGRVLLYNRAKLVAAYQVLGSTVAVSSWRESF